MKKIKIFLAVMTVFFLATAGALAAGSKISDSVCKNEAEALIKKSLSGIKLIIQQKEKVLDEVIDLEESNYRQPRGEDKKLEEILFKIRIAIEDEVAILEETHDGLLGNWNFIIEKGFNKKNLKDFTVASCSLMQDATDKIKVLEEKIRGLKKNLIFHLQEKAIKEKRDKKNSNSPKI